MGWWSTGIMGGDSPLDIQSRFEDKFGKQDAPTPEEAITFINEMIAEWDCEQDVIKQVTGYLVLERKGKFSDELRNLIIEGIVGEDTSTWNRPSERDTILAEFKTLVQRYPNEGSEVNMPEQKGLFESIFTELYDLQYIC